MNETRKLISIVMGDLENKHIDSTLLEHAARNKILLHVLRILDIYNELRVEEERKYRRIRYYLTSIWEKLQDIEDVAMIKFFKPVIYVPSDIDIIVHERKLREVLSVLGNMGFSIQVVEPYCVTLTKNDIIVDLYIYPSVSNIIYLNRDVLLNNTIYVKIDGIPIRTIDKETEVLITIAHAVYKENIITLNDYFTVLKWFNNRVIELAKESRTLNAVNIVLNYLYMLSKGLIEAPVRINLGTLIKAYTEKIINDELTRASLIKIVDKLKDRRLGLLILSKMMRKTY